MKTYLERIRSAAGSAPTSLQAGWEAEYLPGESENLLLDYAPVTPVGNWTALSHAERADWTKERIRALGHGDKSAILERTERAPPKAPRFAYRDDTGNLELRDGPFDGLAATLDSLDIVTARYGAGSLQLTLSLPTEAFFNGANAAREQAGWLHFFAEYDVLDRLARGAAAHAAGKLKEPARNFLHPYLGPLNRRRRKALTEYLEGNAAGKLWTPEDLEWAGRKERSFKFFGGTAYRPDVAGPARVCLEVRDAHRDPALLAERGARVAFYWGRSRASFLPFSALPAYDHEASFDALPEPVRTFLTEAFPSRAPRVLDAYPVHRSMHETYRNFAFPLRDWSAWLGALGASAVEISDTARAQEQYARALHELAASNEALAARRVSAQVALARFALEAPLYRLFRENEARL